MMRRGILTLTRALPPSRRSECVIAFSEIAADGFACPDILGLAAATAAQQYMVGK